MNAAAGQIKSFVERIERLNEERKALSDDVSDIYKEAKANGFDTKALKIVVQRRAKGDAQNEIDAIVETYEIALGTRSATRARATPENLAGGEAVTQRAVNAPIAGSNPARSANPEDANNGILPELDRRSKPAEASA